MIYINANVDIESNPKLNTSAVEKLVTNFIDESLYVTFYARKETFESQVAKKITID